MKVGFVGQVNEKNLRSFFDKTVESTTSGNETKEELDTRFNSILVEWVMEITANENSS
ncbi:MAG: hypothetical protein BWX92_03658 [Deltaproteobacteria bacterium ADurb.Bin135]|nr:MAG: hypothetical protein BWX92_03658 [Deltaproteobacteria bacterium ADurb.Bin135]